MPFQKGRPKTGGRTKGAPNKLGAEVKTALATAFESLGGVPGFVKWGKKYPTEFYKLWVKILPTEIANADGEPFKVDGVVEVVVTSRAEADAVLALNKG